MHAASSRGPEAAAEIPLPGLTTAQARRLLREHGHNVLEDPERFVVPRELLRRFANPLVLVLLGASLVAGLTGEMTSFVLIVAMVAGSVGLDFFQEFRARKASEQLRKSVQLRVDAVRDGARHRLLATSLVPGDLVLLQAGSLIPADGRLVRGLHLFVNQAAMTGEPYPVEKRPAGPEGPGDDELLMGCSVVSGSGLMRVERTGARTALGKLSGALSRRPPPSAFEAGTRRFGFLVMRVTLLMVLFVLLASTAAHRPLLETLLFALALAVGLTPELLPMVLTVTLARGAMRLAGRGVIVKRLAALHDLGTMDVLCTDKTGTLTRARIRLERSVDAAGRDEPGVFELAWLNSRFETGIRNTLDEAILDAPAPPAGSWRKIDELPFDFERKRVSVLLDDGQRRLLIVKGAPEDVLALCATGTRGGEGAMPWDEAARALAEGTRRALEGAGFRVLAVACRSLPRTHERARPDDESGLALRGFLAFLDPPKATAGEAVALLREGGVELKILTGDSDQVTRHLCGQLGIPVAGVLTGRDIDAMGDDALAAAAAGANLFCRVTPAQKNRIILALKGRRRVVGYLGDGINDAPALHSADVGLSVDDAADVAREAADLILTRGDLRVVHEGVLEGRRTFANVRKYVMMVTSSNFGNMFSMAAAVTFLPFLPMLPLQVLLNNVLYDLSELALPLDRVDAEDVRQPQAWDLRQVSGFMLVMGLASSLFDFLTFFVMLHLLHLPEALFQTGWFVESLATQVLVVFVIRTRRSPFASRPAPALAAACLGVVAFACLLPWLPWSAAFGFAPLPVSLCLAIAALVAAYLGVAEFAKRLFYRRSSRRPPGVSAG
ncbi:MAG TPA: magnesium-translocating P-type ATPase [Burkholderiales bacterium]|nr:magnesium-translocating P-type ATPase [Burkholderiales bacterium]